MKNIISQIISFILPITVLIIVPLSIEKNLSPKHLSTLSIGLILICAGLYVMIKTVSNFIVKGSGTLAPWSPPLKLITSGLHAYVRNPMIIGALIVLTGESIAIMSLNILKWAVIF